MRRFKAIACVSVESAIPPRKQGMLEVPYIDPTIQNCGCQTPFTVCRPRRYAPHERWPAYETMLPRKEGNMRLETTPDEQLPASGILSVRTTELSE